MLIGILSLLQINKFINADHFLGTKLMYLVFVITYKVRYKSFKDKINMIKREISSTNFMVISKECH
jgi:hypothetical protein